MSKKFLPVVSSPEGQVLTNYGRYFKDAVVCAWHDIGGQERFNETAHQNPMWFYEKFMSKMIPREVEIQGGEKSIDDLILELDKRVVNVTPKEIEDV